MTSSRSTKTGSRSQSWCFDYGPVDTGEAEGVPVPGSVVLPPEAGCDGDGLQVFPCPDGPIGRSFSTPGSTLISGVLTVTGSNGICKPKDLPFRPNPPERVWSWRRLSSVLFMVMHCGEGSVPPMHTPSFESFSESMSLLKRGCDVAHRLSQPAVGGLFAHPERRHSTQHGHRAA